MRHLNLDQLQTLVSIADLGTFAAAAQALHLAPPTISLHIKELEARLETPLLLRGRKGAELTAAGHTVVEAARGLLSATDDLIERARRSAGGRAGLVRIGVSAGVSTRLLPLMLETLTKLNADIGLRIEVVGSSAAIDRLQAGSLDIALVASRPWTAADVCTVPWRVDPMVALVPSSWRPPATVTAEWLSSRRWATFAPATQMHGLIAGWFSQAGLQPRPFLSLSYPGALKSLAAASQSAAILPLEEVEDQKPNDSVRICRLSPALDRPMEVAYRRHHTPNPAVATVLGVLAQFALPRRKARKPASKP